MWIWKRKPRGDGFPEGFRVQRIGVTSAVALSDLPGTEIAKYFREHPGTAKALLGESYDKRCTPSTFISENGDGSFRVGRFTRDAQYERIKEFQNLADAATDYLLFSLGKCSMDSKRVNRLSIRKSPWGAFLTPPSHPQARHGIDSGHLSDW